MTEDHLTESKSLLVEMLGYCTRIMSCELPSATLRIRFTFASLSLCCEHASAMAFLASTRNFDGSALALLRPVQEASLRTEWILLSATRTELEEIAGHKDQNFPSLYRIAKITDALLGQDFRRHALKTDEMHIHSFTHCGSQALARRVLTLEGKADVHNAKEIAAVIRKAALHVAVAGMTVARRLRRFDVADSIYDAANRPWLDPLAIPIS